MCDGALVQRLFFDAGDHAGVGRCFALCRAGNSLGVAGDFFCLCDSSLQRFDALKDTVPTVHCVGQRGFGGGASGVGRHLVPHSGASGIDLAREDQTEGALCIPANLRQSGVGGGGLAEIPYRSQGGFGGIGVRRDRRIQHRDAMGVGRDTIGVGDGGIGVGRDTIGVGDDTVAVGRDTIGVGVYVTGKIFGCHEACDSEDHDAEYRDDGEHVAD